MTEEDLYKLANEELNSRNRKPDLWARACALATDDVDEARYLYTNLRVEELAQESNIDLTASHALTQEPAELSLLDTVDLSSNRMAENLGSGLGKLADAGPALSDDRENTDNWRPTAGMPDENSLSDDDIGDALAAGTAGEHASRSGITGSPDAEIENADTLTLDDVANFDASGKHDLNADDASRTLGQNDAADDTLADDTNSDLTPAQRALHRGQRAEAGNDGETESSDDGSPATEQPEVTEPVDDTATNNTDLSVDTVTTIDAGNDSANHSASLDSSSNQWIEDKRYDAEISDNSALPEQPEETDATADNTADESSHVAAASGAAAAGVAAMARSAHSADENVEHYDDTRTYDGEGNLFNLYENADGETRAVKSGVSWSALFFTLPWLLSRGMLGTAATYTLLLLVLATALVVLGLRYLDYGTFVNTPELLVAGGFGVLAALGLLLLPFISANGWHGKKLERKGYQLQTGVWAKNRKTAIERYLTKNPGTNAAL